MLEYREITVWSQLPGYWQTIHWPCDYRELNFDCYEHRLWGELYFEDTPEFRKAFEQWKIMEKLS